MWLGWSATRMVPPRLSLSTSSPEPGWTAPHHSPPSELAAPSCRCDSNVMHKVVQWEASGWLWGVRGFYFCLLFFLYACGMCEFFIKIQVTSKGLTVAVPTHIPSHSNPGVWVSIVTTVTTYLSLVPCQPHTPSTTPAHTHTHSPYYCQTCISSWLSSLSWLSTLSLSPVDSQ